ncbi:dihydrofolate reductase family protein [Shimia aestuarii]|uniref:Dihydrofolate reductase n=1 Tax=Shimia aestuarii TaxID=254406 RepID=A0A1I4IX28_9RHOB|nr:dihydrofolate reductase family protein [Shimia aestuarii]SFL58587.1 Dihydrofolate reductase [Shimia aestuarii]
MPNIVFIATSLDGFIADKNGGLDWLESVHNPDGDDGGFAAFMERVDAVVMGRVTFESVVGFGVGWPYPKPGLILSSALTTAPVGFEDHVRFASGTPAEITRIARQLGYETLYIDGGATIQNFLRDDLIDEVIITEFPLLLGDGTRLFGPLDHPMMFDLVGTATMRGQLLQKRYRRKRSG